MKLGFSYECLQEMSVSKRRFFFLEELKEIKERNDPKGSGEDRPLNLSGKLSKKKDPPPAFNPFETKKPAS